MAKKLYKDCSKRELSYYRRAYLSCWDAITDAIRYAENKSSDPNLSDTDSLKLALEVRRLTANRTLLENKRQAFRLNDKKITPPDKTKVERAEKILEDGDEAIKNSKAASQVIAIADKALSLFNTIQSG